MKWVSKLITSEEDILNPINASIRTHSRDRLGLQPLPLTLALSISADALYPPTHHTALSLKYSLEQWGFHWLHSTGSGSTVILATSASHSKRPIYPTLLLCGKNYSSVLPCSSCSTHCLHLLLLETLNVISAHSGTQRQWAKRVLSLHSPCLGGYCNYPTYSLTPVIQDKVAAVVLPFLCSTAG